jgi:hypothetical protein
MAGGDQWVSVQQQRNCGWEALNGMAARQPLKPYTSGALTKFGHPPCDQPTKLALPQHPFSAQVSPMLAQ